MRERLLASYPAAVVRRFFDLELLDRSFGLAAQAFVAMLPLVIVIVSAMSGKTNELVGWVETTSKLYDAREYDAVVASGENVTAGLMALRLQEMGVPARSWPGSRGPVT